MSVIPQTHSSFLAGLALYEKRLDKGYSLTDCVSMSVMDQEGIAEALTTDVHFRREGFGILMPEGQVFVIEKRGVPVAGLGPVQRTPATRTLPRVRTDSGRILEARR